MKVAINCCFGGFGISDEAFESLLIRKSIAFDKKEEDIFFNLSFRSVSYYNAGHSGEEAYCLNNYEFYKDRSDPDLIAVIEEMGVSANSYSSKISIIEIPDDVKWHIADYDGIEHVAENHRTWS